MSAALVDAGAFPTIDADAEGLRAAAKDMRSSAKTVHTVTDAIDRTWNGLGLYYLAQETEQLLGATLAPKWQAAALAEAFDRAATALETFADAVETAKKALAGAETAAAALRSDVRTSASSDAAYDWHDDPAVSVKNAMIETSVLLAAMQYDTAAKACSTTLDGIARDTAPDHATGSSSAHGWQTDTGASASADGHDAEAEAHARAGVGAEAQGSASKDGVGSASGKSSAWAGVGADSSAGAHQDGDGVSADATAEAKAGAEAHAEGHAEGNGISLDGIADAFAGIMLSGTAALSANKYTGVHGKVGVEGFAGAKADGSVSQENGFNGTTIDGNARAGAGVGADAQFDAGPQGVGAKAGVEGFAGADAGATLHRSFMGIDVGIGAKAKVGAGGDANVGLVVTPEDIAFDGKLGAALGLGAGANVSIDIDPEEFVKDLQSVLPF